MNLNIHVTLLLSPVSETGGAGGGGAGGGGAGCRAGGGMADDGDSDGVGMASGSVLIGLSPISLDS